VRKKILLVVISSTLTGVLAFIAAEVYLRHKQLPLTLPPDSSAVYTHKGEKISTFEGPLKLSLAPFTAYKNLPSQRTAVFTINSRGLRAEEGAERDPAPKIVFLGGSAAFGVGAQGNQDTIPYVLESSMKPYKILNAGVVGFLSGQELTYLVTELVDYHPVLVVAYDGWNDLFDSMYFPRNENELGFNSNFFGIESQLVSNYQTQVSPEKSFGRLLEATSTESLLLTRLRQKFSGHAAVRRAPHEDILDAVVRNYTNNLHKMALVSNAWNARFIVVFQPELGQKLRPTTLEKKALDIGMSGSKNYQEEFPTLYKKFISQAKRLLTEEGIEWIDINENTGYRDSAENLFVDVVHTNRQGNEVVANILSPKLLQLANDRKVGSNSR
jgi:hypothetical protein